MTEFVENQDSYLSNLPLLPLRDLVVYPTMVTPLFVGREKSVKALEAAMEQGKTIFLVTQKEAAENDPDAKGLFNVGTVAEIMQMLRLPDGTVKVLVEGQYRAEIEEIISTDYLSAQLKALPLSPINDNEQLLYRRTLLDQFERFNQQVNKKNNVSASELHTSLQDLDDISRMLDSIAGYLSLSLEEKQDILEISDERARLEHLLVLMEEQIELVDLEVKIRNRVKKQMEKSQREYYLNEQMKAIQKELGEMDENGGNELEQLQQRIDKSGMPAEILTKSLNEFQKLKMMSPMSAEASVLRGYIDWLLQIPWKKRSKLSYDIPKAEAILNADHYGLDEIKDRIIEYLAVQKRVKKLKGSILCLVGPPGVGKTSLGRSIARATNRKYVRMALGGVRDEAEIRGHRRTYIGAMPGKIIQKMAKVEVKNPLFLLDEVDKMGMDHRGDPASALLEILDPEQNDSFNDHYLEVDYDLSEVMFVCTSNSMNIPAPLLDRMEIIRIPGYTEDEKLNIARQYLLPKQLKQTGLKVTEVCIADEALLNLIRLYTREAGVRGLEREIGKVCRKLVKELSFNPKQALPINIDAEHLEQYSGVQKYKFGIVEDKNQIGLVTGLAWTEVGGDMLNIEAALVTGKGKQITTGSLGDVMKESIDAAFTVVRHRAQSLGLADDFHEKKDVHIHVPEGATPKDGPSAGIGMCTALVSALTKIPVRADVAMTGEITLRGQVLPIGGLKEKLLAAHRGGIKTVIIPEENRRDLKEVPAKILEKIEVKPVEWIDEVLQIALEYQPDVDLATYSEEDKNIFKEGENSVSKQHNIKAH